MSKSLKIKRINTTKKSKKFKYISRNKEIDDDDKKSIYYEEGVSCPNCINIRSDEQNEKSRQRQAQIVFANKRKNL